MALRTPLSVTPHLYMGDSTGRPLDNGVVYFGEQDKDPEFYPINLFSDDELTKPLMQPVHTKGGYLYDKGDMVEPHAKEVIYSVKVLDSYGRKVFYKGAMMRNSWNDDVIEQINEAILASGDVAKNAFDKAAGEAVANAADAVNAAIEGVAIDANLVTDALTPIVPIAAGANARTQLDKNRESVSLLDFFTKAEIASYRQLGSNFDVSRPLQAFFDYISINNVGTAYCNGEFKVSTGLILGGLSKCLTKVVVGNLKLTALNAIPTMLKIQVGKYFHWRGAISVVGIGSVGYEARLCDIGIHLGGDGEAARCIFDNLIAERCKYIGIYCDDNTTLTHIGLARANLCASGMVGRSLTTKITGVVHTGGSSSVGQRSILNVSTISPVSFDSYRTPIFLHINDEYYYIEGIDRVNNTVEVYPWVLGDVLATSDFNYVVGGGVVTRGGDASAVSYGVIDVADSGIGFHDMAMYASNVKSLVAQSCTVGYARGHNNLAVNYGGAVSSYYTEGNQADLLRVSAIAKNTLIGSVYEFNYGRVKFCCYANPKTDAGANTGTLSGFSIQDNGQIQTFGSNVSGAGSWKAVSIEGGHNTPELIKTNQTELRIRVPNIHAARLFGKSYQECIVMGGGDNDAPTGTITFTAPTGYTLNGVTTAASFTGFTAAARFTLILNVLTMDISLHCLNSLIPLDTYAYSEKVIEPNTTLTETIPVSGAVLGDVISVAIDKSLQGTILSAEVVSTGNIKVSHYNPTASSISIAASTIKVKIN